MVFLGLFGNKDPDKESYISNERRYDAAKRAAFEKQRAELEAKDKPKKSIKDRVSGTVHTLKVKAKARKLKRYKKHKEKLEAKEHETASVDIEAEDEVFGKDLSNEDRTKLRGEYSTYAAERKAVKAERRKKLKEGFNKASAEFGGLESTFSLDGASTSFDEGSGNGLDMYVIDDSRDYRGKRAPAFRDNLNEFYGVGSPRKKGKSSGLDMLSIGNGTNLDLFAIKSPTTRSKRAKQADPFAMFSLSPSKGKRHKKDPWSFF